MCYCKILLVGVHVGEAVGVTVGLADGRTVKQKKEFSVTIRQQLCNVISLRVILPVGVPVGVLLGVADGGTKGHEKDC